MPKHTQSLDFAPGPVVLDVLGKDLVEADRRRILDPKTGGVILFGRNYESQEEL